MHGRRQEWEDLRRSTPFYAALGRELARRGLNLEQVCSPCDEVARRLLEEYGAMFVASEEVVVPPLIAFQSEEEVLNFQRAATWESATFRATHDGQPGVRVELQPAAMRALLAARAEAEARGLSLTPRGGAEAARRSFADSKRLWDSRCHPALDHWCGRGRLTDGEAERLRGLDLREQVAAVLELEARDIFFSKDFTKSILQSVAAPGASQHLAMLAFDVAEFQQEEVRRILSRHGWFQTISSDLPHFTYLGLEESELPRRGLRPVHHDGQTFWIPDTGKA